MRSHLPRLLLNFQRLRTEVEEIVEGCPPFAKLAFDLAFAIAKERREFGAIDLLALQPSAPMLANEACGLRMKTIELREINFMVRMVSAAVDLIGRKKAVGEPLGEVRK